MATVNRIQLVAYLGEDAKVGLTKAGVPWFTMRLATHETWKEADGTKKTSTEWHLAKGMGTGYNDSVAAYGKKGRLVYVEGSNKTRKYMHKDGFERHITEVRVSFLRFLGHSDEIAGRDERMDGIVKTAGEDGTT